MITLYGSVLKALQAFAKDNHPNEIIVLLRGSRKGEDYMITEYLIPPFGAGGRKSASFPAHMLPIDFSLLGTAHSHPTGNVTPSTMDFQYFYGRFMMILGPPYGKQNFAIYNKKGESLPVQIDSNR